MKKVCLVAILSLILISCKENVSISSWNKEVFMDSTYTESFKKDATLFTIQASSEKMTVIVFDEKLENKSVFNLLHSSQNNSQKIRKQEYITEKVSLVYQRDSLQLQYEKIEDNEARRFEIFLTVIFAIAIVGGILGWLSSL